MRINNRTRISIALEILERVMPDGQIIDIKEFEGLIRLLATWEMKFFEDRSIKIVDEVIDVHEEEINKS